MGSICKVERKDLSYAIEKIDYWYKKGLKYLTIITVPFNTSHIFLEIIQELVDAKEQILYVWGIEGENKELITALKDFNLDINHSYTKNGKSDSDIVFVNYKNLINIKSKYKLIIFDDVTYFSDITSEELRIYIEMCSSIAERIIIYSIEKIDLIGEKIELAAYNYNQPFLEPRILTTRIDLNKDIPYSLYDYLTWFRDEKHNVAIYVPDKESINHVFSYFNNKLKLENVKIIKASTKNDIKKYEDVLKYNNKSIFIVTHKIKELLKCYAIEDSIVLFADDYRYTYKKLIYICGYLRKINQGSSEILLVSNNISDDIEKARSMARDFNKKVWDKNLKKL